MGLVHYRGGGHPLAQERTTMRTYPTYYGSRVGTSPTTNGEYSLCQRCGIKRQINLSRQRKGLCRDCRTTDQKVWGKDG